MIDFNKELKAALETVLPAHYEMFLTSGTTTPCISYMELSNSDTVTGDTVGYSRLQYQVKVWGNNIELLQRYALEIDRVLRPLGFTRVNSGVMYDNRSSMMQKILTYEALALEVYQEVNR